MYACAFEDKYLYELIKILTEVNYHSHTHIYTHMLTHNICTHAQFNVEANTQQKSTHAGTAAASTINREGLLVCM